MWDSSLFGYGVNSWLFWLLYPWWESYVKCDLAGHLNTVQTLFFRYSNGPCFAQWQGIHPLPQWGVFTLFPICQHLFNIAHRKEERFLSAQLRTQRT